MYLKFAKIAISTTITLKYEITNLNDCEDGMDKKAETYLTPGQVAKMLMVSPAALRIWAEKGEIKALTTPGGHRRFSPIEVNRFAAERGLKNPETDKKKLSILIVDDEDQILSYLSKLLKKYSDFVDVEIANNGFDAGIKVNELNPNVILLDLMMPGLDGFSVCEQIKTSPITADIRVIAMTGFPSPANIEKILSLGAEACLSKPIVKNELLKLIGLEEFIKK